MAVARRSIRDDCTSRSSRTTSVMPTPSTSSRGYGRSLRRSREQHSSTQASQDMRLGGRATRTQFEFTLQDANLDELNHWAPKILAKMQTLPELRDVATDQQTEGTTLQLKINRDTAARYGITPQLIDDTLYDAFGQRQVTQYFTQLNSYHVIEEILPELQGRIDTLDKIYIRSPTSNAEVPLSVFCKWDERARAAARHRPPGTVSRRHHQLQPRPRGCARTSDRRGAGRDGHNGRAGDAEFELPGNGAGIPAVARHGAAPRFLAALVVVYLILGILYESYIHPLTILLSTLPSAGVGALVILMAFGFDFSLIALIGMIR